MNRIKVGVVASPSTIHLRRVNRSHRDISQPERRNTSSLAGSGILCSHPFGSCISASRLGLSGFLLRFNFAVSQLTTLKSLSCRRVDVRTVTPRVAHGALSAHGQYLNLIIAFFSGERLGVGL